MPKSKGLVKSYGNVVQRQREALVGQRAFTYWLTGLSASGKTTIAYALEELFYTQGKLCYVLDGDNIRHGLNSDLGFSREDRSENIRRIAEVSRLMNDAGVIVITAFITPFKSDREVASAIIGSEKYFEIYLNTPLAVCENRDPKGLYSKARAGEVLFFTGISSPYESPSNPKLTLDTSKLAVHESIKIIAGLSLGGE